MNEELKPCPYCGGEAYLNECPNCGELNIEVIHADDCWMLEYEGYYDIAANEKEQYIAAWNHRTERTCYVIENLRKYVLSDGTELFENGCSVCNGYIGDGDNYCPNCGAKVVE